MAVVVKVVVVVVVVGMGAGGGRPWLVCERGQRAEEEGVPGVEGVGGLLETRE